jgi:hypothetical protein
MKYPWMQFFVMDWLNDPQVSACEPTTRGILLDWLCNMHLLDRSGQITGTRGQLARLGRCTAVQVASALQDLIRTRAADVTFRNDVVTVVNRRMKRESIARKNGAIRVARHRKNVACNAAVTAHSHNSEVISQNKGESVSTLEGGPAQNEPSSPLLFKKKGKGIEPFKKFCGRAERG